MPQPLSNGISNISKSRRRKASNGNSNGKLTTFSDQTSVLKPITRNKVHRSNAKENNVGYPLNDLSDKRPHTENRISNGDSGSYLVNGTQNTSNDYTVSFSSYQKTSPNHTTTSPSGTILKQTSKSDIFATGFPLYRHQSSGLTDASWDGSPKRGSYDFVLDLEKRGSNLSSMNMNGHQREWTSHHPTQGTDENNNSTELDIYRKSIENINLSPRRSENQKVVTFYRELNGLYPELRIVVSRHHFKNIQMLMEDLAKVLKLSENENAIVDMRGNVVADIDDLEDGGAYFFSRKVMPAILNEVKNNEEAKQSSNSNDGRNFVVADRKIRRTLTRQKSLLGQYKLNRQKMLRIINNEDKSTMWSFFLDESKVGSFEQLLQEINHLVQPTTGRIQHLCTKKGRRIRSIEELFHGDEIIVAIANSIGSQEKTAFDFSPATEFSRTVTGSLQRDRRRKQVNDVPVPQKKGEEHYITANGKTYAFLPPSHWRADFQSNTNFKMDETYEIDWIHGYNGTHSRNNLFVLPSGELLYNVAAAVVLHDCQSNKQRYYIESSAMVKSLALHPDECTVAVGLNMINRSDLGQIPHIRVFNSDTLTTLSTMCFDEELLSVECMAFSKEDNGHILATVDSDNHSYRLCIWDWEFKKMFAQSDSYEEPEVAVDFYPTETRSLITCGKGHVYFWTINGRELHRVSGHFFGCEKPQFVNCLSFLRNGDIVTGDSNGTIHFWSKGAKRTKKIRKTAHKGKSIESLLVLPHNLLVTGSGSENVIGIWDTSDDKVTLISELELSKGYEGIVALATNSKDEISKSEVGYLELICGTKQNCILRGTFKTQFTPVTKIHAGNVTGMDVHPSKDSVITVSTDRHVILWSAAGRDIIWTETVEYPCTAVKFYPYGQVVAIGTENGRWIMRDVKDGQHIASFQNGDDAVTCIAYSADGSEAAIGSKGGKVNLYSCIDGGRGYRPVGELTGYSSPICSIDWSSTNSYLRVSTNDFDYSIWSIEDLSEFRAEDIIRDLNWDTQTCCLSFNTSGIWQGQQESTLFTKCSLSHSQELYCAGTTKGMLRLYHYPAIPDQVLYKDLILHSSSVSGIGFSKSGSYLFTASKEDSVLCQWKLKMNDQNGFNLSNSFGSTSLSSENFINHRDSVNRNGIAEQGELRAGHRKLRRQDSMLTPRAKSTTIANWKQDEYRRPIKIEYVEIHDALLKKGLGIDSKDMTQQRTKQYVEETYVHMPVTKEMNVKRMRQDSREKTGIRKTQSAPNVAKSHLFE